MEQNKASLDTLTKREMQVTKLASQGLNNIEIGKELGIAEKTVNTHLRGVYKKLNVRNRVTLATFYTVATMNVDTTKLLDLVE